MNQKTLLITGGSGDIGKSICEVFQDGGYHVFAPGSSQLDCSSEYSIEEYFKNPPFQSVHSFVHCAGWNQPQSYTEINMATLERSIMINSFSLLKISQLITPFFVDRETRITAISSLYGFISRKGRLTYTSSKHSLNGIVKELSIELGPRGIFCNTISPGFIGTRMTYQNNSAATIADFVSRIPAGRLGTCEDIARITFFIGSEQNSYINGQNIVVDGGYSIGGFQNS